MIKCIKFPLTVLLLVNYFLASAQTVTTNNRIQTFDYNWKFALGDHADARNSDFNDANWQNLDLPHDWSIEGKPDSLNTTGNDGGYFPAGTGWYRKKFMVPTTWKGKQISICFEGVYMNSEVFINGQSLGIHPYGYSSFSYELTPHLNFGKENIISVRVDNSQQKNCRWYSGSGIYRHVKLLVTNPIHVDHWGVAITTTDISKEKATVVVRTSIKNETDRPQIIRLNTQLTDQSSKPAGNNSLTIELPANGVKEIGQTITVNNPRLWSPETPMMYKAQI